MYWADKIAEIKNRVEGMEFRNPDLDYDGLIGLNIELRKHIQPIESIINSSLKLKGMNTTQRAYRNAAADYKKQRFLIAKQETLELIAAVELALHILTEGQYNPDD